MKQLSYKVLPLVWSLCLMLFVSACSNSTVSVQDPSKQTSTENNNPVGTQIGNQAPDFSLSTPDNKQLSLKSLRGKAVMIYFWGSWCSICQNRTSSIKSVYESYKDKGFTILGVAQSDEPASWKNYISAKSLSWNHVFDTNDAVGAVYGVPSAGMSSYYILDKNGTIVAKGTATDIIPGNKLSEHVAQALK